MKAPNWATSRPIGEEPQDLTAYRWLCGCGWSVPVGESPAYPICPDCGQRCRILDADGLGYVRRQEGSA